MTPSKQERQSSRGIKPPSLDKRHEEATGKPAQRSTPTHTLPALTEGRAWCPCVPTKSRARRAPSWCRSRLPSSPEGTALPRWRATSCRSRRFERHKRWEELCTYVLHGGAPEKQSQRLDPSRNRAVVHVFSLALRDARHATVHKVESLGRWGGSDVSNTLAYQPPSRRWSRTFDPAIDIFCVFRLKLRLL